MNSEHPEYNRDTNPYPSFGKKYAGERGVISLTSWRARISTVSKTLFSLIKQCPGFHIVLVLSEEEFPKMMDELPDNLKLFAENELIEVLWVYKNYKSFKKVLFTMDKYRDVPVISADDDCIYTCNYAQELYDAWDKDKKSCFKFCWCESKIYYTFGPATIYSPNTYTTLLKNPQFIYSKFIGDDDYYTHELNRTNIKIITLHDNNKYPFIFHDMILPLSKNSIIDKNKIGFKIYKNIS